MDIPKSIGIGDEGGVDLKYLTIFRSITLFLLFLVPLKVVEAS